ncbi:MAG: glycosyltransferase family 2 protein [Lachnospiraceae bacterium]|nr:glycosyltransferase family 2 protein [Lachnospiraceae bacterium]
MQRPAIVTIAYNRTGPLKRLLASIEAASYPDGAEPTLIISIDNSGSDETAEAAEEFKYTHGEKVIIKREQRMGLRNHVLACSSLSEKYGSIIVLEDDLFVAPCFYEYACRALEQVENDDRIGGVSLYNHLFNVHTRESFCAIDDGYDNWYFQIASSWGQAYTAAQWKSFMAWYELNRDRDLASLQVPANVSGWSEKSWLKYYITYLIETGRFFLYPRVSLTTNFGDVGTHACTSDSDLQVPLQGRARCGFSALDESEAVYDAFFEPLGYMSGDQPVLGRLPEGTSEGASEGTSERAESAGGHGTDSGSGLIVDLYGYKPLDALIKEKAGADRIPVLTSAWLPYSLIRSYGRQMRPLPANIIHNVEGNELYLYDAAKPAEPPAEVPEALRYLYEYRGISAKRMLKIIKYRIMEKLGRN